MGENLISVLLVDDEPKICEAAVLLLRPAGFLVEAYPDPDEFMHVARARRHRLVVIDWNLRTCEGTDLCATLRSEGDTRPIGLLSGSLAPAHGRELATRCGANEFLEKPDVETWAPRLKEMLHLPPYRPVSGVGRIQLDGSRVRVRDYTATLGGKERALVEFLLEDPERERSREDIALRVWDFTASRRRPWSTAPSVGSATNSDRNAT